MYLKRLAVIILIIVTSLNSTQSVAKVPAIEWIKSNSHFSFSFENNKPKPLRFRFNNYFKSLNKANWTNIQAETEWEKRAGLQVVNHKGKFYLLGGRKPILEQRFPNESKLFGDVWVSESKGSSWQQILDTNDQEHWPARAYFKAVSKGKYIYVLGGQNFQPTCVVPTIPENSPGCPQVVPNSEFFNDVWRSKNGIDWQRMTANAPWEGRAGLMVEVLRNRIYVFGGSKNDDAAIVDGAPSRIYFQDVWSSSDGRNWRFEGQAPWSKRAGGATLVKGGYIYLLGGEFGFLPDEMGNLPYLNDVWKSRNGKYWKKVTSSAQWSPRPGHQCGVMYYKMVCFGGFGIPFNPTKVWVSKTGRYWHPMNVGAWGAIFSPFDPTQGTEEIKYDFDIVEYRNYRTGEQSIYSFGGDREVFFLPPFLEGITTLAAYNFDRVDNDVWRFGFD